MTLNKKHRSPLDGYALINLIKTKVKAVVSTMSQTENQTRRHQKVNNVIVKCMLVSTDPGTWTLPEKNWRPYQGDVYYQRVELVCDCLSHLFR